MCAFCTLAREGRMIWSQMQYVHLFNVTFKPVFLCHDIIDLSLCILHPLVSGLVRVLVSVHCPKVS